MADDTNGKVTLAVLGTKIDNLTKELQVVTHALERVGANQVAIGRLETQQQSTKKDIEDLEGRVNGWSAINSLGVLIAAIMGIFVNPNK